MIGYGNPAFFAVSVDVDARLLDVHLHELARPRWGEAELDPDPPRFNELAHVHLLVASNVEGARRRAACERTAAPERLEQRFDAAAVCVSV